MIEAVVQIGGEPESAVRFEPGESVHDDAHSACGVDGFGGGEPVGAKGVGGRVEQPTSCGGEFVVVQRIQWNGPVAVWAFAHVVAPGV